MNGGGVQIVVERGYCCNFVAGKEQGTTSKGVPVAATTGEDTCIGVPVAGTAGEDGGKRRRG